MTTPTGLEVSEEERLAYEESVCAEDVEWRLNRHFWIKRPDGRLQLMDPLKAGQKKLLALYLYLKSCGVPIRIIVLKGRKVGSSTFWAAVQYCEVLDREIDALIIAHDLDTTKFICSITHLMNQKYDLQKPREKRSNPKALEFFDHGGRLAVVTANNKMAGTGTSPSFLLASEVAKWQSGRETAISLFNSMSNIPGTALVQESTANGYDDLFYPTWKAAYDNCRVTFDEDFKVTVEVTNPEEWNYYYPVFISVFDDPDCRRPFRDEADRARFLQTLDPHERMLVETGIDGVRADPEYLNYRRFTLKNSCQNDLDIYMQEHPESPSHAFIASGRPRLNRAKLALMPIEKGMVGRLVEERKGWENIIVFRQDQGEFLTIFRMPVPGHRYAMGVDGAEGLIPEGCKKPDESVIVVVDIDANCEQVATLAGQISEENLVPYGDMIGRFYNLAFQVPETNRSTVYPTHLVAHYRYPEDRIYRQNSWKGESGRELGWKTTVTSRPHLISTVADAITDGSVVIHDARTKLQCDNLVWKDGGRVEGQKGFRDDHFFALGMALQGVLVYPKFDMREPETVRRFQELSERRRETADSITGY